MEIGIVSLAIVHDHLVQRGGAERVVLSLARAFPQIPVQTSFYAPELTYPEFGNVDVRCLPINRIAPLRGRHRVALPLLAPSFRSLKVEADVTLCSSAGWAHGVRAVGRKVVYCYAPARWLYTPESMQSANAFYRAGSRLLRKGLYAWDQKVMAEADVIIAISTAVRGRIERAYGRESEVMFPPMTLNVLAERRPVAGLDEGFFLCVSRLLPYKNVAAVVEAFQQLPNEQLVVAGLGPQYDALEAAAGKNVRLLGRVNEDELLWLYANCAAIISSSYEDYGLTPIEAAAFGKPAVVLRWGGFLDTVVEGETGVFFQQPVPSEIAAAAGFATDQSWDPNALRQHAAQFSESRFARRLLEVVNDLGAEISSSSLPDSA